MVHRERGMREWRVQNEYLSSVSLSLFNKCNQSINWVCVEQRDQPDAMTIQSSVPSKKI